MSADSDTIAAICTAPGQAAIGIVRVSGPLSPAIADKLFHYRGPPPSAWPPNTFHYGRVKTADGAVLDEALLLMMRAPHSYTREDVAEFQIHGGRAALCAVLEAVINAGARPAAPGEFTKRAFLNGRLDLVQAEAVMDLISAGSARAARAAVEQLEGALSAKLSAAYDELVQAEAELEATLDFLAEETPEEAESDAGRRIASVLQQIEELLATWREGRLLREGALVVIAGMPNAGKSTLLNKLLGSDRAITAPTPGTTRDIIEETACFEGIPCRLADTAGIRTADCDIEREGVRRAKRYIAKADVLLYVVDAAAGLRDEDRSELAAVDTSKTLLVLNKQDLGDNVRSPPALRTVRTCLLSGTGVGELKSAICELLGTVPGMEPQAAISERHRARLAPAAEELRGALEILRAGDESMTAVAAAKVRLATEALGELLGRNFTDDLLDRVFSSFCIGK